MNKQLTRTGEKMRPYVGMNGRLYFNYCLGAEYLCEEMQRIEAGGRTAPQFRRFVYKVERCEYIGGTEYYYMSRDGRALSSPFGANRLHYLLHFMQVDELTPGTRQELPLITEEIRIYFAARKAQFEARQEEALRILKSIPRYAALNQEQTWLCIKIGYAEARGTGLTATGAPCSCALKLEETIKDYCAALRINRPKAV